MTHRDSVILGCICMFMGYWLHANEVRRDCELVGTFWYLDQRYSCELDGEEEYDDEEEVDDLAPVVKTQRFTV
jgi:hypothetical protein